MHQIRFRLGLRRSAQGPTGGAYSAPRSPSWNFRDLLLRGASKGEGSRKEGRVGEEEEKGNERTGGGRGCAPPTN